MMQKTTKRCTGIENFFSIFDAFAGSIIEISTPALPYIAYIEYIEYILYIAYIAVV